MATRTASTPKTGKTSATAKTGKTGKTGKTETTGKTGKTAKTDLTMPMAAIRSPVPMAQPEAAAVVSRGMPAATTVAVVAATTAVADSLSAYGSRELRVGCKGPDAAELQTRLAGFRGTLPDGDFGGGTMLQVTTFQRDFMKMAVPTGVVDRSTFVAIDSFAEQNPIDFKRLRCPCGVCKGFGQGFFKGLYKPGTPETEMNYLYEYPGIHRLLLWAVRAIYFYESNRKLSITSGYRCSVENTQHVEKRTTTNHHGKAIDLDVVALLKEDKKDDMANCEALRNRIMETSNAQLEWRIKNQKALESAKDAPTWVHYDVRCYERKYLGDEAFCTSLVGLNARLPITC